MSVWTGPCSDLQCVGGNDDNCGFVSLVRWTSTRDTNYYIYVHGFRGATGDYELEISGASNEQGCELAIPLPVGSVYRGSTIEERFYSTPSCGVTNDVVSKGTWFKATGNGGRMVAYTCFNTEFDTMVGSMSPSLLAIKVPLSLSLVDLCVARTLSLTGVC